MNHKIHYFLPKKILSKIMYLLSRIENTFIKNILIKGFILFTRTNLKDAKRKDISEYKSLVDFFTRELSSQARPFSKNKSCIMSPCDGKITYAGNIFSGFICQIKGHAYSVSNLLGNIYSKKYDNASAVTIYLAPNNYHRIHMPEDGVFKRACYIPGELNSVSIPLLKHISGLFAKNERVVYEFSGKDGDFIMVLVGAVNVGSIETKLHGEICPNRRLSSYNLNNDIASKTLKKGDELGRFNLGSTIIYIREKNDNFSWSDNVGFDKPIKMGQSIAKVVVNE